MFVCLFLMLVENQLSSRGINNPPPQNHSCSPQNQHLFSADISGRLINYPLHHRLMRITALSTRVKICSAFQGRRGQCERVTLIKTVWIPSLCFIFLNHFIVLKVGSKSHPLIKSYSMVPLTPVHILCILIVKGTNNLKVASQFFCSGLRKGEIK